VARARPAVLKREALPDCHVMMTEKGKTDLQFGGERTELSCQLGGEGRRASDALGLPVGRRRA